MDSDEFEARMREREYFRSLRLLPGAWPIVRVDGRGFTRWIGNRFEKPFDTRIRDWMIAAAGALLTELGGAYAFTESDEISVLLPRDWQLYDRELEKLVSLSAAVTSAIFTQAAGEPAYFDSRVWLGTSEQDVVDYFRWRQSDAGRCALNGWCYWTLRNEGSDRGSVAASLEGQSNAFKNELLFQRGINFNQVPLWQRRGVGLFWETYEKQGFNPKAQQEVTTTRRRLRVEMELPMKDEYCAWLQSIVGGAA